MKVFKVSGKKVLAGIGIVLLLGVAAGCSEAEKLAWESFKQTQYEMITGKPHPGKLKSAAAKDVQAATSVAVRKLEKQVAAAAAARVKEAQKDRDMVSVDLYFADQNGEYLQAEKREIAMVPGLARATVEELIKGPKGKGMTKTIPEGTRLLDISIDKGVCRVDLSRQFRDNHWGGSSGEILTVYSLVNTLTQFDTVEKVEILVEGRKIDTLAGHMDLSVPVMRNAAIIKNAD